MLAVVMPPAYAQAGNVQSVKYIQQGLDDYNWINSKKENKSDGYMDHMNIVVGVTRQGVPVISQKSPREQPSIFCISE